MVLIVIFIILGLMALLCLNTLYKRTYAFQNQFIDVKKFKNLKDQDTFDIVNLGSNHPKFAFDYSNLGLKGMNWAVGPQTFQYDYAILKKYKKHLNPEAVVIIPVCPLKFFLLDTHWNNRVKYYSIFSKSEMPDYSAKQKVKEYILPLIFHPFRAKYIIRDIECDNRLSFINNPLNEQQISNDATFWIRKCWNPEFDIDIENMQSLSEYNQKSIEGNIRILSDMIKFCIDNGFKPVLTMLPVTTALSSKFSEEFIQRHIIGYINRSNIHMVPVFNYFKDERFVTPDFYINSFFMNKIGRQIFTKSFVNELKF